jgi:hypothetical protein
LSRERSVLCAVCQSCADFFWLLLIWGTRDIGEKGREYALHVQLRRRERGGESGAKDRAAPRCPGVGMLTAPCFLFCLFDQEDAIPAGEPILDWATEEVTLVVAEDMEGIGVPPIEYETFQ